MKTHLIRAWAAAALLPVLAGMPNVAAAQGRWFVGLGGGVSVPSASAGMNTGWLAEAVAGVTLPGNIVSLRLGGTYGRNVMKVVPGNGMAVSTTAETDRSLGVMSGIMLMPDLDRDLIPYVMASAGIMNGRFRGSDPSFAWATGAGLRILTDLAEFYVESRFVSSTGASGHGRMIPITVGLRFSP